MCLAAIHQSAWKFLCAFLLCLSASSVLAQPSLDDVPPVRALDDAEARIVIIKADSRVFAIPDAVKRLQLDHTSLKQGEDLAPSNVSDLVRGASYFGTAETEDFRLASLLSTPSEDAARLLGRFKPTHIERIFEPPFRGFTRHDGSPSDIDMSILYRIVLPDAAQRGEFIAAAKEIEGVGGANRMIMASEVVRFADFPPDDPGFTDQWHLMDRSQEPHSSNILQAWYLSGSNREVTIHISEPGHPSGSAFLSHEDLNDNVENTCGFGNFDPHTFGVAGTLSAVTDNGTGVSGASYNSKLHVAAWTDLSDAAFCLRNGVDFYEVAAANFSWGSPQPDASFNAAMDYAVDVGGVFLGAAVPDLGNPSYPADYDHPAFTVMAVNGHRQDGVHLPNYETGNYVEVSGPGEDIRSVGPGFSQYASVGGSSNATPQVVAVAGMIKTLTDLTLPQIFDVIYDTAQDRGAFGLDNTYGWGAFNGFAALAEALERDQDNGSPKNIVVGDINTSFTHPNHGMDDGETRIYVDTVPTDKKIYVLPNSTIELRSNGTVTLDNTHIIVLGTFIDNTGGLIQQNSGEVICLPGSQGCDFNSNLTIETGGCVLAHPGATVSFNGDVTVRDGGFMVNRGGTFAIADGKELVFESDADMSKVSITPGASFEMGSSANVTVEANSLNLAGTASAPILFEGAGSVVWDGLHIEGDSALLAYVEISDAAEGLDVRATGVALDHVTLSGNATGLRTDYDCPVGCFAPARSSLTVTNSKISENSNIGVYARNTDLSLQSTSIEYNTNYGVYATNATLDPVRDIRLTHTGYDPADGTVIPLAFGRGVYLSASGELHLGGPFMDAPNRVAGNAGDEIWAAAGSYLFVGNAFSGTNAIFDASGGRLITNYDGNVIMAENVYWGDVNGPPTGAFYDERYIDADPFEKADPSGGAGAPFRQRPEEGAGPGEGTVLAAAGLDETFDVAHGPAAGRGEGEWIAWLRTQLRQLRRDLRDNPGDGQALRRLRRIVYLQRLDRDDTAGERAATRAALRLIRRHLENGGSLPPRLRRVAERALRAEIESALAIEEYAWADSLYGAYAAHVATPRERLTLLLAGASLDERRGDYAGAIAKVSEVIAAAEGAGTEEATVLVEVLEGELATLEALLAEAGDGARGTATTAGKGDAASRTGSGLPAEYALEAAYPNPFSGATTLPLALPEAADVRVAVYDVLGREVAVLADGQLEAGRHALSLDGSRLASGVYIVRAVAKGAGAARVLTGRLTFMR